MFAATNHTSCDCLEAPFGNNSRGGRHTRPILSGYLHTITNYVLFPHGLASMRFAPIKTDDQPDLQALHQVRDRWVARRTAVMNQMCGFLMERGITVRKGPSHLTSLLKEILEDAEMPLSEQTAFINLLFGPPVWHGLPARRRAHYRRTAGLRNALRCVAVDNGHHFAYLAFQERSFPRICRDMCIAARQTDK